MQLNLYFMLPLTALLSSCQNSVSPAVAADMAPARTFRECYHPDGIILPNGSTPEQDVHGFTSRVDELRVISNLTEKDTPAS